ncbi:hypothetical protein ACIBCO_38170 [Streptomyces violascens]|uniref:hypothetical protein n=1 Tax=Streptomyces violascens TaxID=67381 RepID=UPI0037985C9D
MFEAFGDSRPPARLAQRKPQDAWERIRAALPVREADSGGEPDVDLFAVPAFERADSGRGLGHLHRMNQVHQSAEEQEAAS